MILRNKIIVVAVGSGKF